MKLIEKNKDDLDKRVVVKLSEMINESMEGLIKVNGG